MSKTNMILLGIIFVLVLALVFSFGFLIVRGSQAKNVDNEAMGKPQYDIKKVKEYAVAEDAIVSNLDTGNCKDKRMIRVKPYLLVVDSKALKEVELRNTEIINIVISILRTKTPEEMIKPQAIDQVKSEILDKINEVFKEKYKDKQDLIVDVLFKEFIMQ